MTRLKVFLYLLFFGLISGVCCNEGVMTAMKITSRIEQRYAQTTVTANMKNTNSVASELKFKMTLPKSAFISSLIMEIEGQNYTSTVKEKSKARKTYESAKKRGKTTGLVVQRDEEEQKFEVSANVAAQGKVIFYLTYEELLRRYKGRYLYAVDVRPGYIVPSVVIDVTIIEKEAIEDVKVTQIPGPNFNDRIFVHDTPEEVHLTFVYEDGQGYNGGGLEGTFALAYDVDMHPDGGQVQIVGDYFVHHFSPEGLPKMPVHTVFVLDVSSSMSDGKLDQLKEAMVAILADLKEEDTFELIIFSTNVKSIGSFKGYGKSLKAAIKKIKKLRVTGSTNLYDAYSQSVQSIMDFNKPNVARQVVFLTDGDATAGETRNSVIRRHVREKNIENHPIFGLAFGNDADFGLLKEISIDNKAFARQIDFGKNTERQLKGFYEEISTPLMAGVEIDYSQLEVDSDSIVKQGNANFYTGGEVVAAGQLAEGSNEVHPVVKGVGKTGPLQFQVQRVDSQPADSSSDRENFVARLWAYLMVQDLLEKTTLEEDPSKLEILKAKALQIALRFNFVTKLTSLVVVRPEDDEEDETNEDELTPNKKEKRVNRPNRGRARFPSRASYVDNDPHFVVSVPGMPIPFCFDVHGHHGDILNLIRDSGSGILVNGQVTSHMGKKNLTYFTKIYISYGNFSFIITPDDIHLVCPQGSHSQHSLWPFYNRNGNPIQFKSVKTNQHIGKRRTKRSVTDLCGVTTTWKKASRRRYGNVILIRPKRKNLHIVLGDEDAHFVVVRSKNKYDQSFLGFYVKEENVFSQSTTGIIGQFSAKNVTMNSTSSNGTASASSSSDNTNRNNTVDVTVQHWNQEKQYNFSQVSGYFGHRRSLLEKVHVSCIFVRDSGRGLLDGVPSDYIVPCISC